MNDLQKTYPNPYIQDGKPISEECDGINHMKCYLKDCGCPHHKKKEVIETVVDSFSSIFSECMAQGENPTNGYCEVKRMNRDYVLVGIKIPRKKQKNGSDSQ